MTIKPLPNRSYLMTPDKCEAALTWVAQHGLNLAGMASAADVHYGTIKRWIAENPDVREDVEQAHQTYIALLEHAAYIRAVEGIVVEETTLPDGSKVVKRRYSDALLKHLLAVNDPRRHGSQPQHLQVSGQVEHNHSAERVPLSELSDAERQHLKRALLIVRKKES